MDNSLKFIDKNCIPTPVFKRSFKLRSIFDCNRLLSKLINLCLMGKLEESRATKLAYIVNVLMKGIEVENLEKRIEVLENNMKGKQNENIT